MLITITHKYYTKNNRVYSCDICGSSFHWDESKSCWYGNYLEPEKNIYMCSKKCKETHENKTA